MACDGSGGLSEEALNDGREHQAQACSPASPGSLNPRAVSVLLSHWTNEEVQRHAFSRSRSHSSMRWHEIQTQLCLPVLIYSPLVQGSTSPPKNVGVTKPGGVGGEQLGSWGEQVCGSLGTTSLKR